MSNEITEKVLKLEKEKLDKRHSVFTGLTNREVVEMLGEDAFNVSEDSKEFKEFTPEVQKAMAKKVFRVDLDEAS